MPVNADGKPIPLHKRIERFGYHTITASTPDVVEAVLKANPVSPEQFDRGAIDFTTNEYPPFGWPSMGPSPLSFNRGDIFRSQPASYASTDAAPQDAGKGVQLLLTTFAEGDPTKPANADSWLMADTPVPNLFPTPATVGNIIRWQVASQSLNPLLLAVPNAPQFAQQAITEQGPKIGLAFNGQIAGVQTFDACGDLIDAYLVKGQLVETRDEQVWKFDYSYAVSPQLGGLIVGEKLAYPATQAAVSLKNPDKELSAAVKPTIVYESSIGSLKPTK